MERFKDFEATGVATAGRLYAGDLNQFQDLVAAIEDFNQIVGANSFRIGDSGIQLLKYGTSEARLTAALRLDKMLRALGGIYIGAFNDTARNALATADRPFGWLLLSTTRGRFEWNAGTADTPVWYPIAVDVNGNLVMPPGGTIIIGNTILGDEDPPITVIAKGQQTSDVVITAGSVGAANVILTATAAEINSGDTIKVEAYIPSVLVNTGGPGNFHFALFEDGGNIGVLSTAAMTNNFNYGPLNLSRKDYQPAAGSHTYSIRAYLTTITQATAKAGGTYVPATIEVTRT